MQRLEVSGAVRPIYGSLGVKRLMITYISLTISAFFTCHVFANERRSVTICQD